MTGSAMTGWAATVAGAAGRLWGVGRWAGAAAVAAFAVVAFAVVAFAVVAFAVAAFVVVVEVEVDPDRCAFPWRCVGTELGSFFSAVPTVRREFLRAGAGVDPVPE
ncbi:MAG: hypothetical protein ACXVYC_19975, partial [Blastococcus sp.]